MREGGMQGWGGGGGRESGEVREVGKTEKLYWNS